MMASLGDLATFFREMQYQLSAGMGVVQALTVLETHAPSSLRRVIPKIREEVSKGNTLSSTLQKFPNEFPPLVVNLVMAGEAQGKLADACANIANLIERDMEYRRRLSTWTLYPKILIVAALFVIFVLPSLIQWLVLGNREAFSLSIRFILIAILLVALYFTIIKLIIPPRFSRAILDILKSTLPGISSLAKKFALSRFLFTLSHLYMAGLPVSDALRLAGESSGSSFIMKKIEAIEPTIRKGERLSVALERARVLPPTVISMLMAGEEGGRVPEALELSAQRLEQEASTSAQRWIIVSGVSFYLLVALMIARYIIGFYAGFYGGMLNP